MIITIISLILIYGIVMYCLGKLREDKIIKKQILESNHPLLTYEIKKELISGL